MLRKLVKYELWASGRLLLPIYGAVIIMGLISSVFLKFSPDLSYDSRFLIIAAALSMVLFFVLIAAAIIASYIFAIYRYKKNLLGSEGYLMNTLPVSVWQNISAKLIPAVIYQLLSIIAVFIAAFLLFTIGSNTTVSELFGTVSSFFEELIMASNIHLWLLLAEITILLLISFAVSNLMFYAAMSVGHSFTNHKVLSSVGVYVAFYIASQFISTFLLIAAGILSDSFLRGANFTDAMPHMIMGGVILLEAAYGAVYFFISGYFMKNKLNLQ